MSDDTEFPPHVNTELYLVLPGTAADLWTDLFNCVSYTHNKASMAQIISGAASAGEEAGPTGILFAFTAEDAEDILWFPEVTKMTIEDWLTNFKKDIDADWEVQDVLKDLAVQE